MLRQDTKPFGTGKHTVAPTGHHLRTIEAERRKLWLVSLPERPSNSCHTLQGEGALWSNSGCWIAIPTDLRFSVLNLSPRSGHTRRDAAEVAAATAERIYAEVSPQSSNCKRSGTQSFDVLNRTTKIPMARTSPTPTAPAPAAVAGADPSFAAVARRSTRETVLSLLRPPVATSPLSPREHPTSQLGPQVSNTSKQGRPATFSLATLKLVMSQPVNLVMSQPGPQVSSTSRRALPTANRRSSRVVSLSNTVLPV